ncbi:CLUMA_CG007949, isoform A [Clunio marinus]|uniref:CLUMA_CG007949, isoform A n=1 Tax=Clunio marinus TaxID=568069 RepID=A0A1J1I3X0_9DIPT|nr:CLUMA_CG007949, isoform A [Clunio marinus]
MVFAWILAIVASILYFIKKLVDGNVNPKIFYKLLGRYRHILPPILKFCFKDKSEDKLNRFKYVHKIFPRYLRMKFLNFDVITVYDPELCKKIFNSQLACQRPFRNCLQLEYGLLASTYHYWKTSRKHLNVAFNLNVLKGFIPIFDSYAVNVVNDMKSHLGGKEFDLLHPLAKLAGTTVAATTLNAHGVEASPSEVTKLIDSINLSLDLLFKRIITPFWTFDSIYKFTKNYKIENEARKFTVDYGLELIAAARKRKILEDKKIDENGNDCEKKPAKVNYIIDQLVNHEEKFTDQEIQEHLMVILITASETTANLVATTIIYLAIYQDIQQKVYEEIFQVFNDENIEVDYDNIGSLKYLEMVVKETLRLFSPIPISARETIDEFDIGLDKPLAKGAKIVLLNYVLHQRTDLWGEDADKFDPERFSPENMAKRDPYCFLPFGAGPRMCIGNRYAMLTVKIEIMRLIKAYRFSTSIKEEEMKMKLSFTGKMSKKHMVTIEERK